MEKRGGDIRPHGKKYRRGKSGTKNKAVQEESRILSNGVLFFLIGLALVGVFLLIRPFIGPIVLALFLVTIFYPLYRRVLKLLRGRRSLTAALSVVGVFFIVIIPFFLFSASLVRQGMNVGQELQSWVSGDGPSRLIENVRSFDWEDRPRLNSAKNIIEGALVDYLGEDGELTDRLSSLGQRMAKTLGDAILPLLSQTGLLVMNFFIMFFIMFYAFRDGDTMLAYFFRILPLSTSHEELLKSRVRYIVRAILMGMLLTAAVQALVAMVGFKIIGIPAMFWGVMLGVTSFIPIVGTALVWVPVTIFMLLQGKIASAIFIFIWCAGGVGSIDNFLRPYLMQGKSGMSTLILFFALLGGIRLFGPIGIFYGPMIFGLLTVMLYIYTLQYEDALDTLDRS